MEVKDQYVTEKKSIFHSKKWWTAIIAALIPIVNALTGLNMDPSEVTAVVVPLVAYVLAQGAVDARH